MHEARVNGYLVQAGPHSPVEALCPACGGEVRRRKRKVSPRKHTWFYRHLNGHDGCPLRTNSLPH